MKIAILGLLLVLAGCKSTDLPREAEATYTSELLACTAQAKLADSGRAGSKVCEAFTDARWGVDGGAK